MNEEGDMIYIILQNESHPLLLYFFQSSISNSISTVIYIVVAGKNKYNGKFKHSSLYYTYIIYIYMYIYIYVYILYINTHTHTHTYSKHGISPRTMFTSDISNVSKICRKSKINSAC
jgi:Ca2+/H+ antiporter